MFTLSKHSFEDKLNSPNNNLCLPPKSAELKKKNLKSSLRVQNIDGPSRINAR